MNSVKFFNFFLSGTTLAFRSGEEVDMSTTIFEGIRFEGMNKGRPYKLSAKGLLTATNDEKDILAGGLSFHVIDHGFHIKNKTVIKKIGEYKNRHVFITGIVHTDDSGQEILDVKEWRRSGRTLRKRPGCAFRLWRKNKAIFQKIMNCFIDTKNSDSEGKDDRGGLKL